MPLTIKTGQPFYFYHDTPSLTLTEIKTLFPSATEAIYCGSIMTSGEGGYTYVYAVFAGDFVTIPVSPVLGDRNELTLKNISSLMESYNGKTIPTSIIDHYFEYTH